MRRISLTILLIALVGCAGPVTSPDTTIGNTTTTSSTTTTVPTTTSTQLTTTTTVIEPTTTLPEGVTPPPAWLGTRPLPLDENGVALPQPTPPDLVDRRFTTTDVLPPPDDDAYHSTISELAPDVVVRSSWVAGCPVSVEQLRYLTLSFWGFDQKPHTGEMIVNEEVAQDVTTVFGELFDAQFPIEEMRVTSAVEIDVPPTGDGNNTESFVCRPVVGSTVWSQHAYGLAIDIDPFQNPYHKGDVVLPELAGAYLDRTRILPGVIVDGDIVTTAFDQIGWGWGGRWNSLKDYQHVSRSGT
jgi:D-alanyl-D-alanine carboxypeptidase